MFVKDSFCLLVFFFLVIDWLYVESKILDKQVLDVNDEEILREKRFVVDFLSVIGLVVSVVLVI